jgi:hypothetical protein
MRSALFTAQLFANIFLDSKSTDIITYIYIIYHCDNTGLNRADICDTVCETVNAVVVVYMDAKFSSNLRKATAIVLIAASAVSLGWSGFDFTGWLLPAISWGLSYFALRTVVELRNRYFPSGRRLAMTFVAFVLPCGHALAEIANNEMLGQTAPSRAGLIRLIFYGLAFFGPELIIWVIADPPVFYLMCQVRPHRKTTVTLPDVCERSLDIRIKGKSLKRMRSPECLRIILVRPTGAVVQDLGVLCGPGGVSSLPMNSTNYCLLLDNRSALHHDINIEIYLREP